MIHYTLWLFLWDDDLDGADSNLTDVWETVGADELHSQALSYVRCHLGMDGLGTPAPLPPTPYTVIAKDAAECLRDNCSDAQLGRLLKELSLYMHCCIFEHGHLNNQTLPNVEDYWKGRIGSSAVNTYTALAE